ncbi:hypothetical protein B0H13DRAFT_2341848 [Mycena leptocephala]|nr:hypothetical protein B0H13DRAFT_2341848 [Mycena leptocephala]
MPAFSSRSLPRVDNVGVRKQSAGGRLEWSTLHAVLGVTATLKMSARRVYESQVASTSTAPDVPLRRNLPMEACESYPQWVVPHTPHARSPPVLGTVLFLRSYEGNGSFFANTTPSTSTAPIHFDNIWSTPLSFAPISTPQSGVSLSGTRKRQHLSTGNDENMPPTPADGTTSKKAKTSGTSTRRKLRSTQDKIKVVIIHALADLLFCQTKNANLLPLARGILYFGCSVQVDIMAYNSRIGTMPSYSTIRHHLEGLSSEEALVISRHGSDPTKAGLLLFDNIQNLARVWDHHGGCENHMNVGISGLWIETWDTINIHVFDPSNKRQRITYSHP